MGAFFGSIYCWFQNFFGIELADYLWGVSSPYSQINSFIGIGWTMLGITLAVVLIFYYVIDHPRLAYWWGWGIFLVINAVINFIVGWQWVLDDYYANKMVTIDPATNSEMPLCISDQELLNFGFSNMFLSIMAFIIFSFILKWWSRNCPNTPF